MKIVVLDGYALNPGDLSWESLQALGDVTIYERTSMAETVARSADAELLLTNKTALPASLLEQLPSLRYVGVLATGYNVVDVAAAAARGITVTNVPAYSTASVAQHTFALLLELTNHTGLHAASVRAGEWSRSVDWCYWRKPLVELDGLTLGLVGFGKIGSRVAAIGRSFGMQILATARTPRENIEGVQFTDLETLLRRSDAVSLHCPLTPETEKLIDANRLSWMKSGAFLINTSRGPLIDDQAVAAALREGRLGGAAFDVLTVEPPSETDPLLDAPYSIITPHLAWATRAARARLMNVAVENVRAFLQGTPQNRV